MTREPFARVGAWLVDLLCVSGWVAVLAVVGAALYFTNVVPAHGAWAGNAISFLVLVMPVTVALARFESGTREATIGKQARRLRVVDVDGRSQVSFGRALLRNAVKVAVPWGLGHVVFFGLVGSAPSGSVPAWLVVTTAAAYVLPGVYLVTLFVGNGRTPYDRLSRTRVVRNIDPVAASV